MKLATFHLFYSHRSTLRVKLLSVTPILKTISFYQLRQAKLANGICFEYPLQDWFDFKIPKTKIPENFIYNALTEEIDLSINKVGIFSQVTGLTEILRQGDRIEIYRALIADPKEARKKKAAIQKKKKLSI